MFIFSERGHRPFCIPQAPEANSAQQAALVFMNIPVLNKPSSTLCGLVIRRDDASNIQATLEFYDGQNAATGKFQGIWNEEARPTDFALAVLAQRANIKPGRKWHLVVAFKVQGAQEFHPVDAMNYVGGGGAAAILPKRALSSSKYGVRVEFNWENRPTTFWYLLRNDGVNVGDFTLSGPYRSNPAE